MSEICVIGLGYIGLPTAILLSDGGFNVIGVDTSSYVIESLIRGRSNISEPGLSERLLLAIHERRFIASYDIPIADTYIVAVPTPFNQDKSADLSAVFSVIEGIGRVMKPDSLVIIESTCPIGTTEICRDKIFNILRERNLAQDSECINLAYCPERVLPGNIMEEIVTNDRIIGGITPNASEKAEQIYSRVIKGSLMLTNSRTAEMAKLIENSFRDTNIAFANEISLIAEEVNVNPWEVIELANRHPRVNILQPGPGVGGHCIAVDPWFLVEATPGISRIVKMAREVNDSIPKTVLDRFEKLRYDCLENGIYPLDVLIMGLTFKANVADMRESPALQITESIVRKYGDADHIHILEPNIDSLPVSIEDRARLTTDPLSNKNYDIVLILVDHTAFNIDLVQEIVFRSRHIIDKRGLIRRLGVKN
ncbi:UDP-N-acetyl-D-mannosamine dehydrogenase [Deinococcus depolymerans]